MPPKKAATSQQSAASAASAPKKASVPRQTGKENAKWTLEDEKAFVGYLADHVAEQGDGNYKMSTFNSAATFLEERRTAGGPKTGTACKNKWARIKEIHAICYKLKHGQGTSGFTWSEERGADIGLEDEAVWEAYIKKNPKAEQFKHKGWPLFDAVDNIIPTVVKGKYMFAPSQAAVPDPLASDDSSTTPSESDPEGGTAPDTIEEEAPSEATPASIASQLPYKPPPPPPAPSSGRKRSALERTSSDASPSTGTPPVSQRLPRETAVSRSIDRMSEVLAAIAAPPSSEVPTEASTLESTPKRRRIAVELAAKQEEEELSDDDMVELVEVIRRDVSAADTYLSLSKTSSKLRRAWVRRVVDRRYS
ncbi:hypothetical protein VTO73DRAFT_3407 [Trametes versicolor]